MTTTSKYLLTIAIILLIAAAAVASIKYDSLKGTVVVKDEIEGVYTAPVTTYETVYTASVGTR
ncbi:hypothetical protein KKG71_00895 [Patescibacteria group bacterium]|nr:hypothetical protein [Patescibacteria group bacterium]